MYEDFNATDVKTYQYLQRILPDKAMKNDQQ